MEQHERKFIFAGVKDIVTAVSKKGSVAVLTR
jgi:hypothetical protein